MSAVKYAIYILIISLVLANFGFSATIAVLTPSTNCTASSSSEFATNRSSIPAAIDAASAGDTIYICGNTSSSSRAFTTERVIINKSLTIIGLNGSRIVIKPVGSGVAAGTFFVTNNSGVQFQNITFNASSATGAPFVIVNTNRTLAVNFTNVDFDSNWLGVLAKNATDVTFSGVVFSGNTNPQIHSDNSLVNLSSVNFTSMNGPIFANGSTGTFSGNVRITGSSSNDLEVLNGSLVSTSSGITLATDHMNMTFSNLANLTMYTDFQSSAGIAGSGCDGSGYSSCTLVSEVVNFTNQSASASIGSLTIFYNSSKITGSATEADIAIGRYASGAWAREGVTSLDTAADSVTYGSITPASTYYGAVSFVPIPASGSSGGSGSSGSNAPLELSDPEFACPDNGVTLIVSSKGDPVKGVLVKILYDLTGTKVTEDQSNNDGEVSYTLTRSGAYRTKTIPPSGYDKPKEKEFDFEICTEEKEEIEETTPEVPNQQPTPIPQPEQPPNPEPTPAPQSTSSVGYAIKPKPAEQPEAVSEREIPPQQGPDPGLVIGAAAAMAAGGAIIIYLLFFFRRGKKEEEEYEPRGKKVKPF